MKHKIIYIGNQLSGHGYSPTSVETLGEKLNDIFVVKRASKKRNKFIRICDMLLLIVNNKDAKIVLIDTYSTSAFWFAFIVSIVSRVFHLPYIPILHGGDLPRRAKRSNVILRIYLLNAFRVVCPSNYLKEMMLPYVDINYDVIPNYIDIKNYSFRLRNIGSTLKILWVRGFHKIYNPTLAVDIVHGLLARGYEVEMSMVGPDKDGSMLLTKDYAAKLGVSNYIKFTGRLSKSQWTTLANEFDVFVNTTNVDNTPVSVMEAMALGMVIISTNVGGMPFLLENSKEGILVPPENPESFIEIIEELVANSSLANEISKNARLKAEDWDWKIVEKKWLKLLNF